MTQVSLCHRQYLFIAVGDCFVLLSCESSGQSAPEPGSLRQLFSLLICMCCEKQYVLTQTQSPFMSPMSRVNHNQSGITNKCKRSVPPNTQNSTITTITGPTSSWWAGFSARWGSFRKSSSALGGLVLFCKSFQDICTAVVCFKHSLQITYYSTAHTRGLLNSPSTLSSCLSSANQFTKFWSPLLRWYKKHTKIIKVCNFWHKKGITSSCTKGKKPRWISSREWCLHILFHNKDTHYPKLLCRSWRRNCIWLSKKLFWQNYFITFRKQLLSCAI